MMTSSNGNIFRVTGPFCGEFTFHRWIPLTKAGDAELWCILRSAPWINGWVNYREACNLRRHRFHYGVIVMLSLSQYQWSNPEEYGFTYHVDAPGWPGMLRPVNLAAIGASGGAGPLWRRFLYFIVLSNSLPISLHFKTFTLQYELNVIVENI